MLAKPNGIPLRSGCGGSEGCGGDSGRSLPVPAPAPLVSPVVTSPVPASSERWFHSFPDENLLPGAPAFLDRFIPSYMVL